MQSLHFDFRGAKVHQKCDLNSGSFQVVDDLRLMLGSEALNRFDFDQHFPVYNHVSVELTDGLAAEHHLKRDFVLNRQSPFGGKR